MKEIKEIAVFIAIVLAVVASCEAMARFVNEKVIMTSLSNKRLYTMNSPNNADVLILGSSRASHHYNSNQISDSLGLKVYNAGEDGWNAVMLYPYLECILKKSSPKMVIVDILESDFDNDSKVRMSLLKPYISKNERILEYLVEENPDNAFLMESELLRLNGDFLIRWLPHAKMKYNSTLRGYVPLSPTKFGGDVKDKYFPNKLSPTIMETIRGLKSLSDLYGFTLVFASSPSFEKITGRNPFTQYCENNNITYFDNFNLKEFDDKTLFNDPTHLNSKGAEKYTEGFIHQLRDIPLTPSK